LEEELNFVALNALLAFGSGWRDELHEACNRVCEQFKIIN